MKIKRTLLLIVYDKNKDFTGNTVKLIYKLLSTYLQISSKKINMYYTCICI